MNELVVCEHGTSGMHIAGTIFGFDCNACLLDMVELVEEIVEEGIETGRLPELTILEDVEEYEKTVGHITKEGYDWEGYGNSG